MSDSNDNITQESLHELFDRIEKLEDARTAPRTKFDIAAEIFAYYEADTEDQWVQAVAFDEDDHVGPMGGKSARVLLKLRRPFGKRNTYKYVMVQVYDDDRIQQAGASWVQRMEYDERNERGF